MTISDPIADMLSRIRNAQQRKILFVSCPHSSFKESVLNVMKKEGYITDYKVDDTSKFKTLEIHLKYTRQGKGVINEIKRVSKPGRRVTSPINSLLPHYNGLGIYIISTSQGVMSDREAHHKNIGGELICKIF